MGSSVFTAKIVVINSRDGDNRIKYSIDKRMKVLRLYLEGVGIMSIERLEGVPNPLIIYWLRHFSSLLREELHYITTPEDMRSIDIVEIDELFTFVQKKLIKSMCGEPLIETEMRL